MTDAEAARIAGKPTDEPDFVNPEGFRWWRNRSIFIPTKLQKLGVACCLVVDPQGNATRLILRNQEIIYESTQLEAIGVHLDLLNAYPDLLEKK